jgi:hypothetical protein
MAERAIGYQTVECEADHLYLVAPHNYRYPQRVPSGTIPNFRIMLIRSKGN